MSSVSLFSQNSLFGLSAVKKNGGVSDRIQYASKPDVVQFSGKTQENDMPVRLMLAQMLGRKPEMHSYIGSLSESLTSLIPDFVNPMVHYAHLAGSEPEFIEEMPDAFVQLASATLGPALTSGLIKTIADSFSRKELEHLFRTDSRDFYRQMEEKKIMEKVWQHPDFINTLAEITSRCWPTSFKFRTAQLAPAKA